MIDDETRDRPTERPGAVSHGAIPDTDTAELEEVLRAAGAAAAAFAATPAADRAANLDAVADALDAAGAELVPLADAETHLGTARLTGELARTTAQLRFLADVVRDGGYLGATIDTADPARTPPWPDLRRIAIPIGAVLVFAASNFPFAFSVPGGDTAAALAVGCPVVVKAHPLHPALSARTGEIISSALAAAGAPAGIFAVIYGEPAGSTALRDRRIRAAAFTGSLGGGRALFDIATSRPDPIPFYGELGSINPVVITRGAARSRPAELAAGLLASITLGTGQFCTKPGLVFVPEDSGVLDEVVRLVGAVPAAPMLGTSLRAQFRRRRDTLAAHPAVRVEAVGRADADGETAETTTVLSVAAADALADMELFTTECFGPSTLLVCWRTESELAAILERLPGSLTATVHADTDEAGLPELTAQLLRGAGRLVWGGWPTGVSVGWAQHHGGPYPATTDPLHTSVGAASISRFLRPVTYQSTPQSLLPVELRDDNELGIVRRVDGALTTDAVGATS